MEDWLAWRGRRGLCALAAGIAAAGNIACGSTSKAPPGGSSGDASSSASSVPDGQVEAQASDQDAAGASDVSDTGSLSSLDGAIDSAGPTVAATITVARGASMGRLPPGYAGFSFEKSHLIDGFFKGANAPLIAMFNLLGPGYVRFGGHDVDNRHWQPSAPPAGAGQTSQFVGTADVDALADFLGATGWQAIYGLNLQSETTPTNDVAEAIYVSSKLGANLHSFEIGNEWGAALEPQWRTFADAITAAIPTAQQTGPAACCGVAFPAAFAQNEASRIALVTYHHYVGAATDSTATAALLLSPDTGMVSDTKTLVAAASTNNVRDGFRWGEINTFSHHGKDGVSNAYAAALWAIDDMLTSAEYGATGVNYHGGGQNMDSNDCTNGAASCMLPFLYSPIVEVDSQVTAAAPLFYGMLFVARAGTGPMFPTSVAVSNALNVTAYSIGHTDGSTSIVIVNKDSVNGLNASVDLGMAVSSASADYLEGPSLSATTGVTFAGAGVSPAALWQPRPPYALSAEGNVVMVAVPPITAVLVHAN
jgi:hypothetical protein